MNEANVTIALLIITAAALFPRQLTIAVLEAEIEARTLWINCRLFVWQWLLYRQLKRDFAAHGIAMPPFRFEPIQRPSRDE